MSRKLKQLEMDFSINKQEPVEQVMGTDVVIMTVLRMMQTTICPTTVNVSMEVQLWDHALLPRRIHHRCREKLSSTIDISGAKCQSPKNSNHDQAVIPTSATTHESCHKMSA
jgi:hypothetical protein